LAIPTNQRIRRPAEFRRVFTRGKRKAGDYVNVAVLRNDLPFSRIGLSVSKRVGNAVSRNLIKRRLRQAFSDMNIADGWDVIITAKPEASNVSYSILDETMRQSMGRLRIQFSASSTGSAREDR
jgi:ribonuclease P protein component